MRDNVCDRSRIDSPININLSGLYLVLFTYEKVTKEFK